MSVAKNSFGLAPYYDYRSYNPNRNGLEANYIRAVASSPTRMLVFGQVRANASTTISTGLWSSSNAINFSQITSAPNTAIFDVAFGNNTWVAVGAAGVIFTAPASDPGTWTARTKAGSSTNNFVAVRFSNGYFFALQQLQNIQSSPDGITWTLNLNSAPISEVDGDNLGQYSHSLVFEKGVWLWFAGNTSTTSSNRYANINFSSITGTTSNNVYADSWAFRWARQDPGDGLGSFLQSSNGTTFNILTRFARIGVGSISGSFQSSNFTNFAQGNPVFATIQNTGAFNTATFQAGQIYESAFLWNGLYYNDGWYTTIYPAAVNSRRIGASATADIYGIGVKTYHESDIGIETAATYQQSRSRVLTTPFMTATDVGDYFSYVKEHTLNGKPVITFGPAGGSVNDGALFSIIGTRAFRPIRTTIDYQK